MKKYLLIIAMMFLTIGASAQISKVKTQDPIKTIAKFRTGFCSLNANGDIYYLSIKTTNKIDSHALIYLGVGEESALQTLKDLLELHGSMDKGGFADFSINIKGKEYKYKVQKTDKYNFSFFDTDAIGSVFFATTEMKSLISKLSGEE